MNYFIAYNSFSVDSLWLINLPGGRQNNNPLFLIPGTCDYQQRLSLIKL